MSSFDDSENIMIGVLVLLAPIWGPFWLVGWLTNEIVNLLRDLGVLK